MHSFDPDPNGVIAQPRNDDPRLTKEQLDEQLRRVKLLYIPRNFMVDLFQAAQDHDVIQLTLPFLEGLPPHSTIIRQVFNHEMDQWIFVISNPSWPETQTGELPPALNAEYPGKASYEVLPSERSYKQDQTAERLFALSAEHSALLKRHHEMLAVLGNFYDLLLSHRTTLAIDCPDSDLDKVFKCSFLPIPDADARVDSLLIEMRRIMEHVTRLEANNSDDVPPSDYDLTAQKEIQTISPADVGSIDDLFDVGPKPV
jgi:hypothetical protein